MIQPAVEEGATPGHAGAGSEREPALASLVAEYADCRRCGLCEKRKRIVPGEGSLAPKILLIGEAPGAEEDEQGIPFCGASGQLLTKMLAAIGVKRSEVYITNVVKCRPPGNRNPAPDEIAACRPFLGGQIAILEPRLIVTLGNVATRLMLGLEEASISRLRGQVLLCEGIRLVPTYHPAYLLRNPSAKRESWEDLKLIKRILEEGAASAG